MTSKDWATQYLFSCTHKPDVRDCDPCCERAFLAARGQGEHVEFNVTMRGKVKFFYNDTRGYGFIVREGGGSDYYFQRRDVKVPGGMVTTGQLVDFEAVKGPRGVKAQNVRLAM